MEVTISAYQQQRSCLFIFLKVNKSPVSDTVKYVTYATWQVTVRLKYNSYDQSLSSKEIDNNYAMSQMSVKRKNKSYSASAMAGNT